MERSMPIDVVQLDHTLVDEASVLLAGYRYEDLWDDAQQEDCKAALERLLSSGLGYGLLGRCGGRYAGILLYGWGFSASSGLPVLHINGVYTQPPYRGIGVARSLLQHVRIIAERHGAARLQLETDTGNAIARGLYGRLGYEWLPHKEVYMCFLDDTI